MMIIYIMSDLCTVILKVVMDSQRAYRVDQLAFFPYHYNKRYHQQINRCIYFINFATTNWISLHSTTVAKYVVYTALIQRVQALTFNCRCPVNAKREFGLSINVHYVLWEVQWPSAILSRSSIQVPTLAWGIALCFWARHFTLIVTLSTQVYFINENWQP